MGKIPYTELRPPLELQVENHSIYVWGGRGQLCKDITEDWIRKQEAKCQNGKYADEAVAAWKAVMASPYADVARCFDCSGYVSWCLLQINALDRRRDCDGLYAKCYPSEILTDGTLLFRVNAKNPNDETHVGVYWDGLQYHSKGRQAGVVAEKFQKNFWAKYGWMKTLDDSPQPEPPDPPEPPEPTNEYVYVKGGSVHVREGNGTKYPKMGTVHRGDYLACYGQDDHDPYWYIVDYKGELGYITCNTRYTELVKKP